MRRDERHGPLAGLTILAAGGVAFLFLAMGAIAGPGATPTVSPAAAPTADRLAKPTLPPQPNGADLGAQVFWLYCMPCHGDRGQGLTAEFRQLYPPTEQNCWASGCHGERPYEGGFTLPGQIPALIGDAALQRFASVSALDAYIRAAMPRQVPGSLTGKEYDQVLGFLARENGLKAGDSGPGEGSVTPATAEVAAPVHLPTPTPSPLGTGPSSIVALAAFGIGAVVGVLILLRRRRPPGVNPPR